MAIPSRIHQVVVAAAPGDAITNEALEIRQLLVGTGMPSHIFARHIHDDLRGKVQPLDDFDRMAGRGGGAGGTVILYHASIGEAAVTRFLAGQPERLAVIYHNMSPPEPFAPYDPGFATLLEEGRAELASLRDRTVLALADSAFNAADLRGLGFGEVAISPLIVEPRRLLSVVPDQVTTAKLAKTGPVLLFVGQLLPHKQPHVLLQAFHVLVTYLLPDARLYLVGAPRLPRYAAALQCFIDEMNLVRCRILKPPVSQASLAACYQRADAVVTLSEHEGFCVPLLEAMAFGRPIVARAAGAVPETLAGAGLLIGPDDGAMVAAEAMYEVLTNQALRADLVRRGTGRLEDFRPERTSAILMEHLAALG